MSVTLRRDEVKGRRIYSDVAAGMLEIAAVVQDKRFLFFLISSDSIGWIRRRN
jgi:hypothetical protein